eukprot:Gb_34788 [translate_table: standard]
MRIIKGDFEGLGTYLFSRVGFLESLVGGHTAEKVVRTVLQEEAQFSRAEFNLEQTKQCTAGRTAGTTGCTAVIYDCSRLYTAQKLRRGARLYRPNRVHKNRGLNSEQTVQICAGRT